MNSSSLCQPGNRQSENRQSENYQSENRSQSNHRSHLGILNPIRHWLDNLNINDPKVARAIAHLIPAQCPFARDLVFFGHKVAHIPPLCKFNPLYEQLMGLRFRSLCYLVDVCGEEFQF
jgi:Mo-dependent nitrogenase C-terminus